MSSLRVSVIRHYCRHKIDEWNFADVTFNIHITNDFVFDISTSCHDFGFENI